MAHLPFSIVVFFLITTLVSIYFFTKAVRNNSIVIVTILLWITLHSIIALTGFYTVVGSVPPRTAIGVFPPLILIAFLFLTKQGRNFIDQVDLKWITLHQSVRLLVEINLHLFFLHKQASEMMTLEGGNLDIFSGLTAPIAWYLYSNGRIGRTGLLIWNFVCLAFVLNAILKSILTAPFPFQVWSFDQPTVVVLYFPVILLLVYIVPTVLFCHLASIRQLTMKKDNYLTTL